MARMPITARAGPSKGLPASTERSLAASFSVVINTFGPGAKLAYRAARRAEVRCAEGVMVGEGDVLHCAEEGTGDAAPAGPGRRSL